MLAWLSSLSPPRRWALVGGALVGIFLLGFLFDHFHLRSPFGPRTASSVQRPLPAEFLYLDNERVGAYLAQLNGGIAKSERLTETLRNEESAKVSGQNFFEVGASAQRENFIERQVTPTAAANFFRLLAILLQQEKLEEVSVDTLRDFAGLGEGTFVRFTSHDLRTPIYANSYLVVRQAGTLKALFPTAGAEELEREEILARRANAKSYAHQVGPNPRIVFTLTPHQTRMERRGGRDDKDESIKFLLPVRYRQLTDERSLIKDGGGRFTVVGKLVRMFHKRPKYRLGHSPPSYVDSATRETWTKPLERVPGPLLEYSSHKCSPASAGEGPSAMGGEGTLDSCVISRLAEQTQIPDGGAVILPIAIYK
jgi:hypothetical protein